MHFLPDRIAAVVLAAGAGSRFERSSARLRLPKLLLPWQGKPILRHVVDAALSLPANDPVILVLGRHADSVKNIFNSGETYKTRLRIIENPEWNTGQSSSLRLGIAEVMNLPEASHLCGAMVLLGDQPLVRPETLIRLAERHQAAYRQNSGVQATAPFFSGRRGNPVILSTSLFPALLTLRGDVGARSIVSGLGAYLQRIDVDDPGVLFDIDSQVDYDDLLGDQTGE